MLSVDDYRDEVALDEPFVSVQATPPSQLPALTAALVAHLDGDGTGATLREVLGRVQPPDDPRLRLRALLTVRGPEPLPPSIQSTLDAVLRAERLARPVMDPRTLPRFQLSHRSTGTSCALWKGDITTLAADAIVNAANPELLGCFRPFHACIDNAIHSAAGPRLREDCARIMRLQGAPEPTGTAKATRAYHLPAQFVLHTVGPVVRGGLSPAHEDALASSYRACLDVAVQLRGVRSVAFCGVSTGVFGFPREPAAGIALGTVRTWLDEHPGALDLVIFDVFANEDLAAYREALAREGVGP